MKNNAALLKALGISALSLAGTLLSFAEISLSGSYIYSTDPDFGGKVLKIGYGGAGSGRVNEKTAWTIDHSLLVGCCPNNYSPGSLNIFGTATTQDVYVGALYRSGTCTVTGGTWNCNGQFQLGMGIYGTLTVESGGKMTIEKSFRIAAGSGVSVKDSSTLTLTVDSNGNFSETGGIYVYDKYYPTLGENSVTLSNASNLVIDAAKFLANNGNAQHLRTNSAEETVVIDNFITTGCATGFTKSLDLLTFTVDGHTFKAGNEDDLNKYLSGIVVTGFEDYAKSFVVDSTNQSVSLHLSKIPEPSAFGLLAGSGALALVVARRRRSRV